MHKKLKYFDYHDFPVFYHNAFIKSIANKPNWAVSDKDKVPRSLPSVKAMIDAKDTRIRITGASMYNPDDMVTLTESLQILPNIANHAYMLDCQKEGWVVMDIEKTCPDDLKEKLLGLPYLYGEYSLSGEGIHLICKLPEDWNEHPEYHKMVKLRQKFGWYEMLMYHWVTFTRDSLPKSESKGNGKISVKDVFDKLITENRATHPLSVNAVIDKPNLAREKKVVNYLDGFDYTKKPEDFPKKDKYGHLIPGGDMSSYEFGYTMFMIYKLFDLEKRYEWARKLEYTDDERAWIIYDILQRKLTHRAKHDTKHNGMPLLLYDAVHGLAMYRLDQDERRAKYELAKQKAAQKKQESKETKHKEKK